MSLPDPRQTYQVCPRCKIALPLSQIVCTNCGFSVASLQSGNTSNNSQIPSSGSGQFKGIGLPSARIPEASEGRGSSLGISQSRGSQGSSLGISQSRGSQGSSLGISQSRGSQGSSLGISQLGRDHEPSLAVQQARGDQVPMSAVSQTRASQVPSSVASQLPSVSGVKKEKLVRKHAT